ncbi:MAG TPA: TlpA disulfide reductase family protein [Terracidiphilus sp.]|nr:TlpA disulfide reductase family protein [Terracidiphilus sp.]
MKRNTVVLGITLLLLAVFAWAGWANWEYRKQAAEKRLAATAKAELVPDASGSAFLYNTPLLNKPAPAFTLQDLSGQKVSLADYKGKAVLVNFWATWCGPCKIETPWLIELRNKYAPQGFEVIGISSEGDDLAANDKAGWAKDKAAIADFVKQMHVQYPVLINGDSLSKDWDGLDAMPTSFFINRSGLIVGARQGLTSEEDIEDNIRKALGEGK